MRGGFQEAGEGLPSLSQKAEVTVIDSAYIRWALQKGQVGGPREPGTSRGGWSRPTPAGLAWVRSARVCPCPSLPPPGHRCRPSHCCWSLCLPLLPPPPPPQCHLPHAPALHVSGGRDRRETTLELTVLPLLSKHFGPLGIPSP